MNNQQHKATGWLKKLLLTILGIMMLLVLSLFMVGSFFQKEVKQAFISSINKQLNVKVETGEINFSLFNDFPNAALVFRNVLAHPSKPFSQQDTLLFASKIILSFNAFELFGKNYQINRLELKNGVLNMKVNDKGESNFVFLKPSSDTTASSLSINLEKVLLQDVKYAYVNRLKNERYEFYIEKNESNTTYTPGRISIRSKVDFVAQQLKWNATGYIDSVIANAEFDLLIENENHFSINNSVIKVKETEILLSGDIYNQPSHTELNVTAQSNNADILTLLRLLPAGSKEWTNDYKTKGYLTWNATVKGKIDKLNTPAIDVQFSCKEGTLLTKFSDAALSNISFAGKYTNHRAGKSNNHYIRFENLKCSFNEKVIKASGELNHFDDPALNLIAEGGIDLAQLKDLLKADTVELLNGDARVQLKFSGTISNPLTYVASGTIAVSNGNVKLKNSSLPVTKIQLQGNVNDNAFTLEALTFVQGNSDYKLSGKVSNFASAFLKGNEPIQVEALLKMKLLDMDELITSENQSTTNNSVVKFPDWLHAELTVSIDNTRFRKFEAKRIIGTVILKENALMLQEVQLQAMRGSIMLEGSLSILEDSIRIICDAGLSNIDINQMMYQFDNFGQQSLTDKNLKGKLNATVQFTSMWLPTLVVNPQSIVAISDVTIVNGELNNFEPMQKLKKYVKQVDLQNIKFANLENQIEIRNRNIVFPVMRIENSAMNFTASGTHNFDNDIDYSIKLALNDLTRREKNLKTEFGTIEEDGLGHTQIFLRMKGPASNPNVKYDTKAVEQHITQSAKQEKQNLKVMLNKEFGLFKKDSSINKITPTEKKRKQEFQVDTDPF
ncbi:MAG: hypothetical protein IPO27_11335 [Bacteroidetes bacterium]|nr:hypothetical protein [Bacteroidota bacterium]